MNFARTTLALSLAATLVGCGGGGEDFTNRPRIRVHWPALGRSLQASAYANSIRVTLVNARATSDSANGNSNDVIIDANRTSDEDSEAEYTASEDVKRGKIFVSIVAFSEANQQGRQIQAKTESVFVQPNGFLPDILLESGRDAVKSVSLFVSTPPGPPEFPRDIPTVYVGGSPQIFVQSSLFVFSGVDATNDVKWTITNSDNPDGAILEGKPYRSSAFNYYEVKAIHPGIVTLKASIDGVSSESVRFRVIPRP